MKWTRLRQRTTPGRGGGRRVFRLVLTLAVAGALVLLPLWLAGRLGVPLD